MFRALNTIYSVKPHNDNDIPIACRVETFFGDHEWWFKVSFILGFLEYYFSGHEFGFHA